MKEAVSQILNLYSLDLSDNGTCHVIVDCNIVTNRAVGLVSKLLFFDILGLESDMISLCESLCENKALKKLYLGQNFHKGRYMVKCVFFGDLSPYDHLLTIVTIILSSLP